jgi:hypothetical protein
MYICICIPALWSIIFVLCLSSAQQLWLKLSQLLIQLLCVCICVCKCACFSCLYVCLYIQAGIHECCIQAFMSAAYRHSWVLHTGIHACCIQAFMRAAYIHMCSYRYPTFRPHTYVSMHIDVYIYIYIYIYIINNGSKAFCVCM